MSLRPTLPRLLACLVAALALPAPARAQLELPDSFTNLKVLPKNITRDQLLTTMRTFSGALGVRCDFCHTEKAASPGQAATGEAGAGGQGGGPPRLDFASDKKDQKRIARSMLRMVTSINKSYLAKIAELDTPRVQVACITCHHGVSEPRTLADVLAEEAADKGVASAVRRYGELKTRYYGSGAYDFREGSLDELATRLTSQEKPDDALAVLDLAEREFPQSGTVPFLQAEALLKKGDKAAAITKYQRALELQPRNPMARRRLTELQGTP